MWNELKCVTEYRDKAPTWAIFQCPWLPCGTQRCTFRQVCNYENAWLGSPMMYDCHATVTTASACGSRTIFPGARFFGLFLSSKAPLCPWHTGFFSVHFCLSIPGWCSQSEMQLNQIPSMCSLLSQMSVPPWPDRRKDEDQSMGSAYLSTEDQEQSSHRVFSTER